LVNWIRHAVDSFFKKKSELVQTHSDLIKKIEHLLGYQISLPNYFIKALTHRSYLELSQEALKSNERLEFLGDSVLGLIVAEFLFKNYNDEGEGFLTKTRSHLVNREALADAAENMGLINYILYDKRFLKGSTEGMRTIMADALEALIGAIFIDGGIKKADNFVCEMIIKPSLEDGTHEYDRNFKGQLLEFTHANKLHSPQYKIVNESGPDHDKEFFVEVYLGDDLVGYGVGKNKKNSEQEAAKNALAALIKRNSKTS